MCVLCVCVCVCVCRIIENLLSKREKKKFVDTILEEFLLSHDGTRLQERYAQRWDFEKSNDCINMRGKVY